MSNLYLNWLNIERRTKTMGELLEDLNNACGTKYKHNWPSVMRDRGYALDRLPTSVRQYMMSIVLPEIMSESISKDEISALVRSLT